MKKCFEKSHWAFCVILFLLITFSISVSVFSLTQGREGKNMGNLTPFLKFYLIVSASIVILSIMAGVFSYFGKTVFLDFFEGMMVLVLLMFCILLIGLYGLPSPHNCQTPANYFSLKMLESGDQAAQLLCSESCPCPENQRVSDCLGWKNDIYSYTLEYLEQEFDCSGWCSTSEEEGEEENKGNKGNFNKNQRYFFAQKKEPIPTMSCSEIVKISQSKIILPILVTFLILTFLTIVAVEIRIFSFLKNVPKLEPEPESEPEHEPEIFHTSSE